MLVGRRLELLTALALLAVPAAAEDSYELWYSVTSRVRSVRVNADLIAGGRLLMSASSMAEGGHRLALERPLEEPWKFFWVDPLGPLASQAKLGAVATLPEGSWDALNAARERIAAVGRREHAKWQTTAYKPRRLDGTFAFVVIGSPDGRFSVDIGPEGTVTAHENHLTDHWLPGPFSQFLGPWGEARGYWFWNAGERKPPPWEPHSYHGLEAALELLKLPLPTGELERSTADWSKLRRGILKTLTTLAPRTRKTLDQRSLTRTVHLDVTVTRNQRGGVIVRQAEAVVRSDDLRVVREERHATDGTPLSDVLSARWAQPRSFIELEVGYRKRDRR